MRNVIICNCGICDACIESDQEIGVYRELLFNNNDFNYLNPKTIQSFRQNIPELIVQDCIKEFNFDDEQAEKLRTILLARGVNKWFYIRRELIKLKHEIKEMLKDDRPPYNNRSVHNIIEKIYIRIQHLARTPRWVEWPISVTHKWKDIERRIIIKKGRKDRGRS